MKIKNNVDKAEWEQYLKEVKGLERDYMAEIVKSRSLWQKISLATAVFAVVAVLYHQFNPVTHKEPLVMRVDNNTGAVDVVSTVKDQQKTYGEVVDKYFIANYVKSYDSYNYHSIQDDYDKVALMSSDNVAAQYQAIYNGKNGQIPRDKLLGREGTRTVEIVSVVPDVEKGVATVRYKTETQSSQTGNVVENWTATLTYEYVAARIDDNVRLVNPLGFVITSYRIDKELQ